MTRNEAAILQARAQYGNDDCEIDDNAAFSDEPSGLGVWVSAWVWVSNEEIEAQITDS